MTWTKVKLKDFLTRSKIPIDIINDQLYKRVTIKTKHQGVSLRDTALGSKIGTKKQFLLKSGQFVLSKIDARFGAFGIASDIVNDAIITGNFWAYDVNQEIASIEWINWYTNSPQFYDLCERSSRGITHRKYLDETTFLEHEIDLPSIEEQKKIIERIQDLNLKTLSLRNESDKQISLLKKIRQQILQDAIQGKLVPQNPDDEPASILLEKIKAEKEKLIKEGKIKKSKPLPPISEDEIPFKVPENWTWCRLGDICADLTYGTSTKSSIEGEVPVLRMGNITLDGNILFSNLKYVSSTIKDLPRLYLKRNDLLFNRTNSYELVGKSAVFNSDERYTLASYLIRVRFCNAINSEYVCNYINSSFCRQTQIEPGVIQQNGQANFNGTKLSNILVPIPPYEEQSRIVSTIQKLARYYEDIQKQLDISKNYYEKLVARFLKDALSSNHNFFAVNKEHVLEAV